MCRQYFSKDGHSVGKNGVGSRVFWWLAGVVFWPRLFCWCAIGTRTISRFARKKKEGKNVLRILTMLQEGKRILSC